MITGRTSKATKHLKDVHNIISEKTSSEENRKRSREEYVEELRSSNMFFSNPSRMRLLLETQRIINNCLPFSFGDYEESKVLNDIAIIPEMRTNITYQKVRYFSSLRNWFLIYFIRSLNQLLSSTFLGRMRSRLSFKRAPLQGWNASRWFVISGHPRSRLLSLLLFACT